MPDISGVLTTLNHALPAGLNGTRLAQWRLRNGRTYDQVRADVAAALDETNRMLLERWGDLVFVTTDDYFEYPSGGEVSDMPVLTDLDRPIPRKGGTSGHHLPLRERGAAIGGSERFFRDARETVITATLYDRVQSGLNAFEKDVLTRALSNSENLISGTNGYEVGFASGSTSVTYAPPAYGGSVFLTTHNHYVGFDSSSNTFANVFNELARTVQEHGHEGPFIAYVSETDVNTHRALADYVRPTEDRIVIIDRGGATTGSAFYTNGRTANTSMAGGRFFGYFSSTYGLIELRATARIPSGYVFLYKSYGTNDQRNPIAIRVHPDVNFGFYIREIPSFDTTWPVKQIDIRIEYGVSVGSNRTLGAAGRLVSGGTWANPTIS